MQATMFNVEDLSMVEEHSVGEASKVRTRKVKAYPGNSLEEALTVAKSIKADNAGLPMNRLDLAESLGRKPSSSGFRNLITSSSKYGLTRGTYQSKQIALTDRGLSAVAPTYDGEDADALLAAMVEPPAFADFYNRYDQNKFPQDQIAINVLERDCGVDPGFSKDCLDIIRRNGIFTGALRVINGSEYVDLNSEVVTERVTVASEETHLVDQDAEIPLPPDPAQIHVPTQSDPTEKSIPPENKKLFVGHGKNKEPVEQLERVLTRFQIPFVRAEYEAHRSRPISVKVADTMKSCNASMLIFTADEEFRDTEGNVVWRPSENVIHELGAASVLHGERVVIFKEKGLNFPSNFQGIGYIEFEKDQLEATGVQLISELISFGLLTVSVG